MSTSGDGGVPKINPRRGSEPDERTDRGQAEPDPQGRYRSDPTRTDSEVEEPDEPYDDQQLDPASTTPDPDAPGASALHPIDQGAVEPNEPA